LAFEKASKAMLGLGPPDAALVARGEQKFVRFSAVLDQSLKERTWRTGQTLTIADFSVGAIIPSAVRLGLPMDLFAEIGRWFARLAKLPYWQFALAQQEASTAAWRARS
jgi:glutathione S-transferase